MVVVLEVLKICEILEGILKVMFGLNGFDVMFNLFLGNIFIINNGVVILKLLNLDSFVGWIIVEKIIFYCCVFGNGGILFFFFLMVVLREVIVFIGIRVKDNGMDIFFY